jgi:hypothetical protein
MAISELGTVSKRDDTERYDLRPRLGPPAVHDCCHPEGAGLRINVGILVIAAGAIIAFAIRETSSQVNLTVVGIIIMLGGAAGLWLSYRIASERDVEEITMIKPTVEEQYDTTPHKYAIDEQIDVTPVDDQTTKYH